MNSRIPSQYHSINVTPKDISLDHFFDHIANFRWLLWLLTTKSAKVSSRLSLACPKPHTLTDYTESLNSC